VWEQKAGDSENGVSTTWVPGMEVTSLGFMANLYPLSHAAGPVS
jgi:malate synthase